MGRPSTSITRPEHAGPTGTMMLSPVLRTFMPRFGRRRAHGDRAHDAVAQLLLDLERQSLFDQRVADVLLENERVVHVRHRVAREFHVDDRADALNDGPGGYGAHVCFLKSR
jgi:hypothetical protein